MTSHTFGGFPAAACFIWRQLCRTPPSVTAILLLALVSCGGDLPTQPSATPQRLPGLPQPELASDIVGDYQLTFRASASCSLPTPFMKRTYQAHIRAWVNFPNVAVDVAGATFFHEWVAGFDGTRNGNTVRFEIVGLRDDSFDSLFEYSLAESIEGTKWLTYDGAAVASIRGKSITGTFNGQIALRDDVSRAVLAECRATDHKVDFVR